jgi:patatin-like phospholipase/acyl hydrolase
VSPSGKYLILMLLADGGGIRGLSSLIILKHLMTKIEDAERAAGSEERVRLPCHYFDFIVGTSTGG